ncbi:MAG: DUF4384 domain-containing protein, partial [Proteobacteria bacterium]|nr:DUF4384 domain-containing protein [Pseudomonadota bacterium]
EEVMGKLRAAYQASGRSLSSACPSPEMVIAYALEELTPDGRTQVHAHLSECRDCLDLVLDLRSARAESQEAKQEVREGGPVTVRPREWMTEFMGRLREVISGLLSFPRLVPAAVALGILAVVSLGLYQHLTAPISIQLDLIGQASDGLLTRGPSEDREIPVPRGGVLRSGDRFQVVFATNKDAYVYIFFQDNTRKITTLFSGKVQGNKRLKLPGEHDWFKLDETKGQEEVIVMAAKSPIVNLDEVVKQLTREGISGLQKAYPQSSFQSFSFKHE